MKQYIFLPFLLAALPVCAQTLTEEVFIDREITPVVQQTARPSWINPTLLTPHVQSKPLAFNEFYGAAKINRSLTPLEPVQWADSVVRSPYRGYASLGYFPAFNLGAAAGYRLMNTDKYKAGVKFSYDGNSWNGFDNAEGKYKENVMALGLDGEARFSPGTLKADFSYKYWSTDMADYEGLFNRGTQAINIVDLNMKWLPSKFGVLKWNAGFNFGYGGFTNDKTSVMSAFRPDGSFEFSPVKDLNIALTSNLYYSLKEKSGIALDASLRFRHVNEYTDLVPIVSELSLTDAYVAQMSGKDRGSVTMGIITLSPGYCFVSNNLKGRLGITADFNTGGSTKNVTVAPDIELQWAPESRFAAKLTARGSQVMNTNASLWQRSPWMTGVLAYDRSHINADVNLSLTFGLFKGFHAVLYGGFASVSDWALPVVNQGVNTWIQRGFSGWSYGLELGYAWTNYLKVVGHAEGATHGKYYRWQDNAKWSFDIAAKVKPIAKLQVEVGYAVRTDRFGYAAMPITDGKTAHVAVSELNMGNTSNLFVGGEYEFTKALSFFLKVENLLNHHWLLTPNVRSNGIHGLLGAQLKF